MNLDQFETTDLSEIRQTVAEMVDLIDQNKKSLEEIMAEDMEASIMSFTMVDFAVEAILEDL